MAGTPVHCEQTVGGGLCSPADRAHQPYQLLLLLRAPPRVLLAPDGAGPRPRLLWSLACALLAAAAPAAAPPPVAAVAPGAPGAGQPANVIPRARAPVHSARRRTGASTRSLLIST